MTRARDSIESGLTSAQKQAEDQTRRLLEVEEQLQIAKEQIVDLKQKLATAEGAKKVAEWAKDEALRAKKEAVFARTEAECSKEKAVEEAYDLGVAETQATLKAQVPRVCRFYCSQVWNKALKQAGVEASFDLWKAELVYYPSAIREDAPSNSEVRDAPEEVEAVGPDAALAITSSKEPAKESDPSGAAETNEGQNPDAPQETIGFTDDALISFAEGPILLVEPLQSVPLSEGFKDLETSPAQLFAVGAEARSKE